MRLKIDKEWLDRKLAKADDTCAGAGGTSFDKLERDVDRRVVTPSSIARARSELGKVVIFVREKKGISRHELAVLASLGDEEIEAIETRYDYVPSLRAIIYLADALELSRDRMKELSGLVAKPSGKTRQSSEYRFAASSNSVDSISDEEYEAVRALVEVLSEKK